MDLGRGRSADLWGGRRGGCGYGLRGGECLAGAQDGQNCRGDGEGAATAEVTGSHVDRASWDEWSTGHCVELASVNRAGSMRIYAGRYPRVAMMTLP